MTAASSEPGAAHRADRLPLNRFALREVPMSPGVLVLVIAAVYLLRRSSGDDERGPMVRPFWSRPGGEIGAIATRHGLTHHPSSFFSQPWCDGEIDGIRVHVRRDDRGDYRVSAALTDRAPIKARRRSALERGLRLGDPEFDRQVYLTGDEARVRASFDSSTRALVQDALQNRRLEISGGTVLLILTTSNWLDDIDDALRFVVDLTRRLSRSGPEALVQVALVDAPIPALKALECLDASAPPPAALMRVLRSRRDAIALEAARRIGPVAAPQMAEHVADPTTLSAVRYEALLWLADIAPDAGRAAAIGALIGEKLSGPALLLLARCAEPVPDAALMWARSLGDGGEAAGLALTGIDDARQSERLLMHCLTIPDARVVEGAVDGLRSQGTADAIAGLRRVATSGPSKAIRSAAEAAITEIQARIGVDGGALSLTRGRGGSTSLTRG